MFSDFVLVKALDKRSAKSHRSSQLGSKPDITQKLGALQGFMERMTEVKDLLERATKLGEMPDLSERALCQPILKEVG